jgi:hypothetical protein
MWFHSMFDFGQPGEILVDKRTGVADNPILRPDGRFPYLTLPWRGSPSNQSSHPSDDAPITWISE